MNHPNLPVKPAGLLGAPTGAAWSYLTTDTGGNQTTDVGGKPKALRDSVMAEAIRRSQSGIVRGDDTLPASKPGPGNGKQQAVGQPAQIARWDSWVKSDLVRTRLLCGVGFEDGQVFHRGDGKNMFAIFSASKPVNILPSQAEWVRRRARFREDRFAEIEVQADQLWPFWDAILHLDVRAAPRTHELLHAGLLFAASVVLQIKHALAVPRPSEQSPFVMPIIEVPGHGSFPSGHATAAYLLSGLVTRLLGLSGTRKEVLQRLAYRVAYNREVAGLHYPIDSAAGRLLGETLAAYVEALALGGNGNRMIAGASFEAQSLTDAQGDELASDTQDRPINKLSKAVTAAQPQALPQAEPLLAELWHLAHEELVSIGRLP